MALIPCPECNHQISDNAHNCPYCGYPIRSPKEPPIIVKQEKSEGCFLQTLNVGCMFIFIIAGLIGLIFLLSLIFGQGWKKKVEAQKQKTELIQKKKK